MKLSKRIFSLLLTLALMCSLLSGVNMAYAAGAPCTLTVENEENTVTLELKMDRDVEHIESLWMLVSFPEGFTYLSHTNPKNFSQTNNVSEGHFVFDSTTEDGISIGAGEVFFTVTFNVPAETSECEFNFSVSFYEAASVGEKPIAGFDGETVSASCTRHKYGEPEWNWTEFTSATATFTCANDPSHVETFDAEITEEALSGGSIRYTAAVSIYGKTYTDSKIYIPPQPTITKQPESVTVLVGETVTFTVAASGSGLSYQWQFRKNSSGTWADSGMTGAKTATLTVEATTARNGYQYRCKVTNAGGSVTSNAATLTVAGAPTITTQPKSVTAELGETVNFTVVASSIGLSYQWQFRKGSSGTWADSGMPGAKTATLTVEVTAARNGYQYRCNVSNAVGAVTSNVASLTVAGKPTITTQPKSVTADIGEKVKFTVAASGSGLSYQWQFRKNSSGSWEDSSMTGAKTATLTVEATAARNGYQYRCKVTNAVGSVTSNAASLTVNGKPTIITQPKSVSASAGETVSFTVVASGSGLTYQWQFRTSTYSVWTNSSMPGAKTATLTVEATTARNNYQYRCLVKNVAGSVYSGTATLTVGGRPTITTQPKSAAAEVGETVKFSVVASGSGLSYQWQFRSSSSSSWQDSGMPGAKTATMTVEATAARNGYQYRCIVSNAAGSVTSSTVTLAVGSKPTISTQPKSVNAKVGDTVTFTVAASGSGLSYQWQFRNGSSGAWQDSGMTGAKTATLTVEATAARSGYQYRCIVTNAIGSVTSSEATLTVAP